MTKAELREYLLLLKRTAPVYAHEEADRALLDYIDDPEIAHAYEAIPRRYS